MKSLFSKIIAVIFIFVLAAGCASSLTGPAQSQQQQQQVTKKPNPQNVKGGTDLLGDIEKPG
jgi:PBP1b-binding outer membrane lipoprotein LpoB